MQLVLAIFVSFGLVSEGLGEDMAARWGCEYADSRRLEPSGVLTSAGGVRRLVSFSLIRTPKWSG